jgi:hypothetical protein
MAADRFTQSPRVVQRVLLPRLTALARRRAIESTIERYLRLDAHLSAEAGIGRLSQAVMRGN